MVGMPHLSGRQKLRTALLILATEQRDIVGRLQAAYQSVISIIDPQLDLPPELKDEFVQFRAELQTVYFAPTPRTFLSAEERQRWASRMAGQLVTLYDRAVRET